MATITKMKETRPLLYSDEPSTMGCIAGFMLIMCMAIGICILIVKGIAWLIGVAV